MQRGSVQSALDPCTHADPLSLNSAKAIWDFEGIFCSSRHIPGVRFAGLIHPGILGCAPSPEILAEWNKREAELISTTSLSRIVAQPPQPTNVHAGSADEATKERVGKEGARTIPGRPEHGGNCDIKNLSRGSKVYLPVHVKGAKFSVGDLHFSRTFYSLLLVFSFGRILHNATGCLDIPLDHVFMRLCVDVSTC